MEEAAQRAEKPRPEPKLVRKIKDRKEAHRERGLIYRTAWCLAGVTLLLAGLAMLVLPGPALLVIPIGLAMLALEFAWAEHLLERAVEQAEKAGQRAKEASAQEKVLSAVATACAIAGAVAAALIWDIPVLPV